MKALVTGGGGFLGKRVVELLLSEGHDVTYLARNTYPDVEAIGASGYQADIRNADSLVEPLRGVDSVFHVAAKAGAWGPRAEYHDINVTGTANLLQAARNAGVRSFIHTSTPSVVSYRRDIENGGQDLPYARRHAAHYSATKARAEQMVLQADAPGFRTVALRPHLIFGPGDPHLLPRFITGAMQGRLRIIGNGTNSVDFTYIDNAAWAHIDAATSLAHADPECAGRAYFITNGEPVKLWPWFNNLLERLDLPPVRDSLSHRLAKPLFTAVEFAHRILPLGEPLVTGFLADALARGHWFDPEPARRDLGYEPRVSMEDALIPTVDDLRMRFPA